MTTFKFLEPSSLYKGSSLLLVSGSTLAFLGNSRRKAEVSWQSQPIIGARTKIALNWPH